MKFQIILSILVYFFPITSYAQWTGNNLSFTSPGTNYTKFQFAEHTWSGSHAILFNAYMDISYGGSIGFPGNTKFANSEGSYKGGAGAIMFFGNGGTMDFLISPSAGTLGAGAGIDWGVPKLKILRNGEVKIGSSSNSASGYLLSVEGKVRATEILVNTLPWPDYVFSQDYRMMTLFDLEAYIDKEGHLPNMPKGEIVEKEGIELGVLSAKLLEKIEELTIYIIELNKKIEKQNGEIESLRSKLN